jgi:hypothetical protein
VLLLWVMQQLLPAVCCYGLFYAKTYVSSNAYLYDNLECRKIESPGCHQPWQYPSVMIQQQ